MKKLLKNISIKVIPAVFLLFLCSCASYYSPKYYYKLNDTPFSTQEWLDYSHGEFSRCYMYKDCRNNHLKLGMHYNEVIKLLGKPDYYLDIYETNNQLYKDVGYNVGTCSRYHSEIPCWTCYFHSEDGDVIWSMKLRFNKDNRLIQLSRDLSRDYSNPNDRSESFYMPASKKLLSCDLKEKTCSCNDKGLYDIPINHIKQKCGLKIW